MIRNRYFQNVHTTSTCANLLAPAGPHPHEGRVAIDEMMLEGGCDVQADQADEGGADERVQALGGRGELGDLGDGGDRQRPGEADGAPV